jgi:hemolysin activation/secretion protein
MMAMLTAVGMAQELPPAPAPPTDASLAQQPTVHVQKFVFEGNQAIATSELQQAVAAFTGRTLTAEELEQARVAVTQRYIDRGFINSGAVLPDQDIAGGQVRMQIVEGRLTQVNLTGNRHLRTRYLRPRIERGSDAPLNIVELRDRLELLRLTPPVEQINAQLQPGSAPGEATLDVSVAEQNPFHLGLQWANDRPPSVGAERLYLLAWHDSLTGFADPFNLRYGITTGGLEEPKLAGIDEIDVSYAFPITVHETTLGGRYARSNTSIIEQDFEELDFDSNLETFSVSLRQPLLREPGRQFALALSADHQFNETFLAGEPFKLTPGADADGRMADTVLRFSQEFTQQDDRSALALRSSFNFGIDALGSTNNNLDEPDGEFFSWLGQGQFIHRLLDSQNLLVLRGTLQAADQRLLALEQLSLGGMDTVRGYRENQVIRDNGAIGSVELRLPLLFDTRGRGILYVAPFLDGGLAWNHGDDRDSIDLASAGLGLLINPDRRVNLALYWGYPFRDFDTPEDNAQDLGLHFNVTLLAF